MAHTMYTAEAARAAEEQKQQDLSATDVADDGDDSGDELPSKQIGIGESKYAKIGELENGEEVDQALASAIMNRGLAPKQGGEDGVLPTMNSDVRTKSHTAVDILARAKEMEKGR